MSLTSAALAAIYPKAVFSRMRDAPELLLLRAISETSLVNRASWSRGTGFIQGEATIAS
jgi:hypothetical protein